MVYAGQRRSADELEQLKREAIDALEHLIAAMIERSIQVAPAAPANTDTVNLVRGIMTDVFANDLRSHLHPEDTGWRTIHQFYRTCNKVRPGWASKQTFYHRVKPILVLLSEEGIVQKRPIKKRLGKGRAQYEFRINPDAIGDLATFRR